MDVERTFEWFAADWGDTAQLVPGIGQQSRDCSLTTSLMVCDEALLRIVPYLAASAQHPAESDYHEEYLLTSLIPSGMYARAQKEDWLRLHDSVKQTIEVQRAKYVSPEDPQDRGRAWVSFLSGLLPEGALEYKSPNGTASTSLRGHGWLGWRLTIAKCFGRRGTTEAKARAPTLPLL